MLKLIARHARSPTENVWTETAAPLSIMLCPPFCFFGLVHYTGDTGDTGDTGNTGSSQCSLPQFQFFLLLSLFLIFPSR